MTQTNPTLTAKQLLDRLSEQGFLEKGDPALEDFVTRQHQNKGVPIYLHILIAIGALIASFFFILMVFFIFDLSNDGQLPVGILFVIGAIGLIKLAPTSQKFLQIFLFQASVSFMLAGKVLIALGIVTLLENGWGFSFALLILTVATYHLYPMSIDRFLSTFGFFGSILINLFVESPDPGLIIWIFNGMVFFQCLALGYLITNAKIKHDYFALKYGLLCALATNIIFLAAQGSVENWAKEVMIQPWVINAIFCMCFLGVLAWIADDINALKKEPLLWACVGILLLSLVAAPGILLAMIIMVVGYAKNEKLMVMLGALLMPVFLFYYYANLNVSLLQKSTILVASGALLLIGRFYLHYRGWHKGRAT